jgi:hypothetical protein
MSYKRNIIRRGMNLNMDDIEPSEHRALKLGRAAIRCDLERGRVRVWPIEGSVTYGVSEQLAELFRENVDGTLGSGP